MECGFLRFTSSGGTGLGMYIVKNFVELLAGSKEEGAGTNVSKEEEELSASAEYNITS